MLAAAVALWVTFWLWVAAPKAGVRRRTQRLIGAVLLAETLALLVWSHGTDTCVEPACSLPARVAGVAARVDLPALALLLGVLTGLELLRAARAEARTEAASAARPRGAGSPVGPRGSRRS